MHQFKNQGKHIAQKSSEIKDKAKEKGKELLEKTSEKVEELYCWMCD